MEDGSLLRGEVLARWQEFVGTGEFFRQVESTVSRVRDRFTSFLKGEPPRADDLGEALQSGVEALVSNRAEAPPRRPRERGACCRAATSSWQRTQISCVRARRQGGCRSSRA